MDTNLNDNLNKSQGLTNKNITLNNISSKYSKPSSIPNKSDKIKNALLKILKADEPLNLKYKYFFKWKNGKKSSNIRSFTISKIENKKIKFDISKDSAKKNQEKKNLLESKININLFQRLINKQDDKLKYFFEKWKNLKYLHKTKNYNIRKREIKKLKILPKKKTTEFLYPKIDDDIHNNIINILNKFDKSSRIKVLEDLLIKIEEMEKNQLLNSNNSYDNIIFKEKIIISPKNKISARALKKIKNAFEKNDIKEKYFKIWKKLTTFTSKSNKSIKRIILTPKQKDLNRSDYEIKSYKTSDNIIKTRLQNELNNYILTSYKKGDKNEKNHIKMTISKILKLLEDSKKELQTPSTPFNDSSFSFSFIDMNTDRSEEESFTNKSVKSVSGRMCKRLRTIFEKNDIKMAYFKRWKENVKLKSKKNIKRIVLNKKEKEDFLNKLIKSNIVSRKNNNDIESPNFRSVVIKTNENIINDKNILKNEINKSAIQSLDDYLNSKADFDDLENSRVDNFDNYNKTRDNKFNFERISNSEITPKKHRNSNLFNCNSDFKIDIESLDKSNKMERYSATPGRYKMRFRKVKLTRSKNKSSSKSKKSLNNKLIHIIKIHNKKKLQNYFNIWKNNENSEDQSDKENEDILEIIKTNDIKLENSKNKNSIKNQNDKESENNEGIIKFGERKNKNSSLNGIYGICYTEEFIKNRNKEEYISIYGNEKSKEINYNIQRNFSAFLNEINFSIATFNLFNYYSQFHDNKFLIKKKFLPIWRKVL